MRRMHACAVISMAFVTAGATISSAQPANSVPPRRAEGFSIALVEGDLRSAPGAGGALATTATLPPVAEKALADMKDFLPYRQYRLLDMQWTRGINRSTIRLKGSNDREYEIQLQAQPSAEQEMRVVFELREPDQAAALTVQKVRFMEDEIRAHQAELDRLRTTGASVPSEAGVRRLELEQRLAALRSAVEYARGELAKVTSVAAVRTRQPLIDTTFNMRVGETVVVGTSRLQADKALIVLLTAVDAIAR
jgi:hypothetical protein